MTLLQSAALDAPPVTSPRRPWNLFAAGVAVAIFAALSAYLAFASKGFLEGDSMTHYSMAHFALKEHHYLVSVWGRPFVTLLYVYPAQLGPVGVRMVSLGLALICGVVTYRLAAEQGYRWPASAMIFLFAQPIFFLHSFSELTELPFATILVLAFWAFQRRKFLVMAILVALMPTCRPEGFAFILLAGLALVVYRKYLWLLVLPIPILVWSYLGWVVNHRPDMHWWMWLKYNWPYSSTSPYGSGNPFWFVGLLPALISPLIFPSLFIGIGRLLGQGMRGLRERDHLAFCKLMLVIIPLTVLAGHSFLWWRGLQASNGELRYLVVAAPMWALLCAAGWEWVFDRFRLRGALTFAGIAALLPALINLQYPFLPLPEYDSDILGKKVAEWYKEDAGINSIYPKMMSSLPQIYYYLDESKSDPGKTTDWGQGNVITNWNGTVLVWDPEYGMHNSDAGLCVPLTMLMDPKYGWVFLRRYDCGDKHCLIFLSRRDINRKMTPMDIGVGSPDEPEE